MNPYLVFIITIILASYTVEMVLSRLNLRALRPELPREFRDLCDPAQYARSQNYTAAKAGFAQVSETVTVSFTLFFILIGGFNWLDLLARGFGHGPIGTGLIFQVLLFLLWQAVSLPFALYGTFGIEERFGFNKTTPATFGLDLLKAYLLAVAIGGPLLAFILWFFAQAGPWSWLYCWGATVLFMVTVQFLAPVVIMPLFNKFTPLAEGELKEAVTRYAEHQRFTIKGIYTMDGSKRSTKLNAYFTGFGASRRIVFLDTLLAQLSTDEIVAVLAHEMGHFKLKHIHKMMAAAIIQMGFMFYILSLFINNQRLFEAFGMQHLSVYASLVFFSFLYAPISSVLSLFVHYVSRQHEYQADHYAARTTGQPEALCSGLKKLSVANLSNLTPHPWYVFFYYSHPPILERLRRLAGGGREGGGGASAQVIADKMP